MTSESEVFESSSTSDIITDDEFSDEQVSGKQMDERDDEEDEKVIEEAKDSNFADAMNKILASSVDNKENPVLAKRKLNYSEEKKEKAEKLREARLQKLEKKRIAELGHVVPSADDEESEKALRRIATKGVTALFNAIKRSKDAMMEAEADTEKKDKREKKMTSAEHLHKKIQESTEKLADPAPKTASKWAVLDENMVEKTADLQNWDTKEEAEDDWDEEAED